MGSYRLRRFIAVVVILLTAVVPLYNAKLDFPTLDTIIANRTTPEITGELKNLDVKGRAPKTRYERSQFGDVWSSNLGCDTRNSILARDLTEIITDNGCKIESGRLADPYTGLTIQFKRGTTTSDDVQIDHVIALSNAWQTGAQQLSYEQRVAFANDPLNLLAVDGPTNEQKSDGDAATWLPPNKAFRCQYVNRQISVKSKYRLWVTPAERDAMSRVLVSC